MASFENYCRILPLPFCRKTSCFSIRYQQKLIDPLSVCWYVTKRNGSYVVAFETSSWKFWTAFSLSQIVANLLARHAKALMLLFMTTEISGIICCCKRRVTENVPLPFRLVVDWWTKWREGPLARISPRVWCSDCQYRWWRYDFVRSHRLSWNFHGEFFPCFVIIGKMCTIKAFSSTLKRNLHVIVFTCYDWRVYCYLSLRVFEHFWPFFLSPVGQ